jgi:hypothetical protein
VRPPPRMGRNTVPATCRRRGALPGRRNKRGAVHKRQHARAPTARPQQPCARLPRADDNQQHYQRSRDSAATALPRPHAQVERSVEPPLHVRREASLVAEVVIQQAVRARMWSRYVRSETSVCVCVFVCTANNKRARS